MVVYRRSPDRDELLREKTQHVPPEQLDAYLRWLEETQPRSWDRATLPPRLLELLEGGEADGG